VAEMIYNHQCQEELPPSLQSFDLIGPKLIRPTYICDPIGFWENILVTRVQFLWFFSGQK